MIYRQVFKNNLCYTLLFLLPLNISLMIAGWNNISSGKSSSLPASISNIITYLLSAEKPPKLQVGPTFESSGPTLLIVAANAVKLVVKSLFSSETSKTETVKIIINVRKIYINRTHNLVFYGLPIHFNFLDYFRMDI